MSAVPVPVAEAAEEISYIGVNPAEAYTRGLHDINFFMALALPTIATSPLPKFYTVCWQILVNRDPEDAGKILRFALGLPRGHAKTTFMKVLIAWLIVYNRANFILIVCASEALAIQVLADIDNILGSPNMEAIYGRWTANLSTDSKELKKAIYQNRPVTLAAKGAESSLRGININNDRPDVILLDDAQTRENDESPTARQSLLRWMVATLFKAIRPRGDRLIIYIGNMYSDHCILKFLQESPSWVSLITGAILEDGTPLWPELFSLEELMEGFLHDEQLGQGDLWFAEVMNDPKSAATTLLPNPLPSYSLPASDNFYDGYFITVDPAGFRNTSDDNVIVGHAVVGSTYLVDTIIAGNMDPMQLIQTTITLALDKGATLIGIETVAYQQTLKFWVEFFLTELKIPDITVVELSPHGRHKDARIRQFVQELYAENYYIVDGEARNQFVWQAHAYKIGSKDNKDDILDACAYGLDIRNDHWHLVGKSRRLLEATPRVVDNNTPF